MVETPTGAKPVAIQCRDGVVLGAHHWASAGARHGTVIINPATGVLSRYYHYYAAFLAENGFEVLTYDYRGIGLSRPPALRGCGYRWRDWGELDFDAVVRFAMAFDRECPLFVVGHSFGGYLPGLSENAVRICRMLTVGAQFAYWRDYERARRARLFLKWHVAMPLLTALCGYFPGKRLGWLEDLPAGVAHEWSFRRRRMELSHPPDQRTQVLQRFEAVRADILAITVQDDDLGTVAAIARTLDYYRGAKRAQVILAPADLGFAEIGHFGLFHNRQEDSFWRQTLIWLRDGLNPWPDNLAEKADMD